MNKGDKVTLVGFGTFGVNPTDCTKYDRVLDRIITQ